MSTEQDKAADQAAHRARMSDLMAELLAAEEAALEGQSPDDQARARTRLHQDILDGRRRRDHAKAKAAQPTLATELEPADMLALLRELRRPITPEEEHPGGLDMLARTIKECETAGRFDDLLFALVRFYRKAWGENHWGFIQAELKS